MSVLTSMAYIPSDMKINENNQDYLRYPCLEGSLFTGDMEPPLAQVLHHLEIEHYDDLVISKLSFQCHCCRIFHLSIAVEFAVPLALAWLIFVTTSGFPNQKKVPSVTKHYTRHISSRFI